jgi:hypothetical protein
MQHVQGGAAMSGPYAALSRSRFGSGEALHRHALCMPMQLPYSKGFGGGCGDLDFGRDYDGQVDGNGSDSDGGIGVTARVGSKT